uniref:Uncharacterized protein n=1 Tax=Parascaris equorum TaxID=6256 RepID=A0A914RRS7_PAREQ
MELSSKDVNFHAPEWDPESRLYVDIAKGQLGENVFSVNEEIGTPQWQFADRQYATNQHDRTCPLFNGQGPKLECVCCDSASQVDLFAFYNGGMQAKCASITSSTSILMNVSGKLHFKWRNGNVDRLETPLYTQFKCLALNTRNIAYCVASGLNFHWLLRNEKTEFHGSLTKLREQAVTVVRESRDAAQIDSLDISVPELIEFSSGGYTVSGWFYPPFNCSFEFPEEMSKGDGFRRN